MEKGREMYLAALASIEITVLAIMGLIDGVTAVTYIMYLGGGTMALRSGYKLIKSNGNGGNGNGK